MTSLQPDSSPELAGPIDILEQLYSGHGWNFERNGDEEIVTSIKGTWSDYELRAMWQEHDHVLQFIALAGINSTAGRGDAETRGRLYEVLSLINEQLWIGHFEIWSADGSILFRHGMLLEGMEESAFSLHQAQTLVDAAIDECERYYPVFQFVLWGGKTPREALSGAMIETEGEA